MSDASVPDVYKLEVPQLSLDAMSNLSKACAQIGPMAVQKYLPKGMALHPCDIHGHFLSHYSNDNPLCPLCISHNPAAEGTSASDVELYINLRDANGPAPSASYRG